MGGEIGISLRVDAQTEGLRKAGQDFDQFSDKIGAVLGVSDPAKAEQFWDEYNSGLDKAVNLSDKMASIQGRSGAGGAAGGGPGGAGGRGEESGEGRATSFPGRDLMRLSKSLRGGISGASKDIAGAAVGAGEGVVGQIGNVWGSLSAGAKVAGGVVAGVVAAGAITNELSKQYEAVIPAVMSATAAIGRFGKTAEEQSSNFRITMGEISKSASSYGYTFQQGASVVESLARGGVKNAIGASANVMAFAKGYGFQNIPSEFSDFYGLAERMGKNGNTALGYAAGGAHTTVGDARIQEFMSATEDILESGLSEGVIKGFDEITGTQRFLSSMFGPLGQGSRGAQMYSQLSAGVRGATGLQSETDLLMYRAARGMGKPGEDYTDTMMRLEGGFSPEIFKQFKSGITGATQTEQIELIRKAFGVSYTNASKMLSAKTNEELSAAVLGGAPGGAIKDTAESQITGSQEKIANELRLIGAEALDIKNTVISGTAAVVQAIAGDQVAALKGKQETKKAWTAFTEAPQALREASLQVEAHRSMPGVVGKYEPWMDELKSLIAGPSAAGFWPKVSPDQAKRLSAIDEKDSNAWTTAELKELLSALKELKASVDQNTGAAAAPVTFVVPATGSSTPVPRGGKQQK